MPQAQAASVGIREPAGRSTTRRLTMCGLAGLLRVDGAAADIAAVRRMAQTLRHRGPDGSGAFAQGAVALGHTRLSVLDLSAQGSQPMHSADGRFVLAYNGEIYNFRDLRRILEAKGHRFRSRSDTEVVLCACMEWGLDCFRRLEGMFALALWDGEEQRLTLARDRFGIKPLYYCNTGRSWVFGSEVKALLASAEAPSHMDWAGLHEYLHFGVTLGESTLFQGVRKLPPGHVLTLSTAGANLAPYASALDAAPVEDDQPSAADKVRKLLEKAVASHLVSDVPVGLFLSGGLDSSAIAAFASKHYGGRLRTYAASFDFNPYGDELPWARQVAERFNTDHQELRISGAEAAPVLERLVHSHDLPFGDPASIPLYLLCAALKGEGLKVVLGGDGADELFGGYGLYRQALASGALRWCLAALAPLFRRLPGKRTVGPQLGNWPILARTGAATFMARLVSADRAAAPVLRLFAPEARRQLQATDPLQRYREHHRRLKHLSLVQRMMHMDCAIRLPDRYLEKVDRASMAHGVEVRVPMLDSGLAAYALGLPAAYKVRPEVGKLVLRQALRTLLPAEVLKRPKMPFGVPVGHWLCTSWAEYLSSVLLDGAAARSGLFDNAALERVVQRHVRRQARHERLLFQLLSLALWVSMYRVAT